MATGPGTEPAASPEAPGVGEAAPSPAAAGGSARLSEVEARILGSLVEKSLTTPDQYPLSVKGLTAACNQKTSREPVMELPEEQVGKSLFPLIQRKLVEQRFEVGSRVPRFKHHIELLLGDDAKVVGALCVLLLRGPQTPGEIKGRSERLCAFAGTAEVEALLQELCSRPDPLVARLPRQPGQKESRYQHLLCGAAGTVPLPAAPGAFRSWESADRNGPPGAQLDPTPAQSSASAQPQGPMPSASPSCLDEERLARLEARVQDLEARIKALEDKSGPPSAAWPSTGL